MQDCTGVDTDTRHSLLCPCTGRCLEGRDTAVRPNHTTQPQMPFGGPRDRSFGDNGYRLPTTVRITSRSAAVSTSSTGLFGASRA